MEKSKNIVDRSEPVTVCYVIPFFLFWGGFLAVSFFESAFAYLFALTPFFIYVFFAVNVSELSEVRQHFLSSLLLAVLSDGVMAFLLATGLFTDCKFLRSVGQAAFVNVPFLLFFAFCGFFCVAFRLRWGCLFYDWPDSK